MAEKIKLTPAMLAQHSAELSGISNSYKSSLKNIDKILKDVNSHWSKALANNFGTKITQTTKMTSALTDTLDTTVSVISTIGNKFENLDKELSKVVNGEEIKKSVSKAGKSLSKTISEDYKTFQKMMNEAEKELKKKFSKKQIAAIEKALKELIGENRLDEAEAILEILRGKADWDTYIKGISAVAYDIFEDNAYVDAVVLTLKNMKKYIRMNDALNNAVFQAACNHDFSAIGKLIAKGLVKNLGGAVVDIGCQLIDSQLSISKYVKIMKEITGIDLGLYFNEAADAINSFWDSIFG